MLPLDSRNEEETSYASPPNSFPSSFCTYNSASVSIARSTFLDARSVLRGFNNKTVDPLLLKCLIIDPANAFDINGITKAIDQAQANGTWLILLFQRVDETGNSISVPHALLQQIVDYLVAKKAHVVTMSDGLKILQSK